MSATIRFCFGTKKVAKPVIEILITISQLFLLETTIVCFYYKYFIWIQEHTNVVK